MYIEDVDQEEGQFLMISKVQERGLQRFQESYNMVAIQAKSSASDSQSPLRT